MSSVNVDVVEEVKVKKIIKKTKRYVVVLNQKEAEALLAVCSNIGGDTTMSRRKYFSGSDDQSGLYGQLLKAGLRTAPDKDLTGTMDFTDTF